MKYNINEKFMEESDPIQDMGIGLKHVWKIEHEKAGKESPWVTSERYFKTKEYRDEAYITYIIMLYIMEGLKQKEYTVINIQQLANKCINDPDTLMYARNISELNFEKIEEGLKNFYYIDVKLTYNNKIYENTRIDEKFTDDSDPIKDLGIGLTHKIKCWLDYYWIKDYKINSDLTIDTFGSTDLDDVGLDKLPKYINFNISHGDFLINWNNLHNMIRCPKIVEGDFYVNGCPLTSLNGIPKLIKGLITISSACRFSETDISKKTKVHLISIESGGSNSDWKYLNVHRPDYYSTERIGKKPC